MSIQKRIARVLIAGGFTAKGAAGVIGNAYQESGLNPQASDGHGNGGLWGFTSGSKSMASLESFASSHGLDWRQPETQAKFLLTTTPKSYIQAMNNQSTARGAAAWWMNNWEKPYVPTENAARRMNGAQETYKMLQGGIPGVGKDLKKLGGKGGKVVPTTTKVGTTTTNTVVGTPKTTIQTTGGTINWDKAILDTLLAPPKINASGKLSSGSSLLNDLNYKVSTGAYTTPVVNTIKSVGAATKFVNNTKYKMIGGKLVAPKGGGPKLAKNMPGIKHGKVVNAAGDPINPNGKPLGIKDIGVVTPKAPWNPQGKPVAEWIVPILQYAYNHGWRGSVESGYRSDAEQTAIYKSGVRPAAVPRSMGGSGSNHEGNRFPAGAVDIVDAAGLAKVLEGSPYAKTLVYAGSKDPVHFSHPHDGGY